VSRSIARCTHSGVADSGVLASASNGLPSRNLGTTCAPRRIARNVRADTDAVSTAMSAAELPMPSTSTRLPRYGSGSR
jgi:hypothetical protein